MRRFIGAAELAANGATSANTASTIVKRDAFGNIYAGIVRGTYGEFISPILDGTGVSGIANNGVDAWGVSGASTTGLGVAGYSSGATGAGGQFVNSNASGRAISAVVSGVEVMTVTATGVHAGPGMTGTPLAHGVVGSAGNFVGLSHSTNVGSITRTATGTYEIEITGEVLDFQNHTAMITMADSGPGMTSFFFSLGHLILNTYNSSGTSFDRAFTFVIFKM